MINFVLCDDNLQLVLKQKEFLQSIFIKNNLEAKVDFATDNIDDLINFVNYNKVDVLFLDIDLNSRFNGIELAKQFRKKDKEMYLIFVTGHFEYIVSAYECKTFDFIQKPFTPAKLEKTVLRLFDDINFRSTKFIKIYNSHELINQDFVNYIQKSGMRSLYNTNSGIIETYGSFSHIADELPPSFIRCHKSYIVNIDNISNVDFKNNTISFKDTKDDKCYIGPKYKSKLMEVLNYEYPK